jgi:hypothetical protein
LGVPLYVIGFGRERDLNEKILKEMATSTGGSYHRAANRKELYRLFGDLSPDK